MDIPVGLNYNFMRQDKLDLYAALGVIGSKLVSYRSETISTIFGDNLNRSPYKDFLVSAKIGMGSLIKTGKLGINIEPQIRCYLQKVYRENIDENPIHFGIQFSILKL